MKTIKRLLAACLSAALMLSVPIPMQVQAEYQYFNVEGCDCRFYISDSSSFLTVKDIAEDAAGPDFVIPASIDPQKITKASLRDSILNGEFGEWDGEIPVGSVDLSGYSDFKKNTNIENLILPEGISSFYTSGTICPNLKSVQIPKTLTRVRMQNYMTETDDGYTIDLPILDKIPAEAGDFILFHDFLNKD